MIHQGHFLLEIGDDSNHIFVDFCHFKEFLRHYVKNHSSIVYIFSFRILLVLAFVGIIA